MAQVLIDWTWPLTAMSLIGAFLNAQGRRSSFALWVAADLLWAIAAVYRGWWSQAALWIAFTALSAYGWVKWGKDA